MSDRLFTGFRRGDLFCQISLSVIEDHWLFTVHILGIFHRVVRPVENDLRYPYGVDSDPVTVQDQLLANTLYFDILSIDVDADPIVLCAIQRLTCHFVD